MNLIATPESLAAERDARIAAAGRSGAPRSSHQILLEVRAAVRRSWLRGTPDDPTRPSTGPGSRVDRRFGG